MYQGLQTGREALSTQKAPPEQDLHCAEGQEEASGLGLYSLSLGGFFPRFEDQDLSDEACTEQEFLRKFILQLQ